MNVALPGRESTGRLLVVTAGIPHPTQGASIVLFFHYIDRLRRAGYRILHLLLLEGDSWPEAEIEAYRQRVAGPSSFEVIPVRTKHFVTQGRVAHRLNMEAISEGLEKALAFRPEATIAFDIVPAWVASHVPASGRLVWLGDLHFQTMWLHGKYETKERVWAALRLPTLWLVSRAWREVYSRVLRTVDQVLASSASSVPELASLGVRAEYEPYPWPDQDTAPIERAPPALPSFLFFGNLIGLGSRSALHFTVDQVYPRLRALWPAGFKIYIAGRGDLPAWFVTAIADKPEFVRLGFVADLDSLMARCHAVLAPIDVPVGNRSRILTAMARGALVVTHKNASLGNPDLVDRETCYLADNADDFVQRMRLAVEDENEARAIVARARRRYMERFHPVGATEKLATRVATLLRNVLPARDAHSSMVR